MPPFMGQGMCSGLRDAWNLGWKLDRVLTGRSSERLLDAYEKERAPHVDGYIRLSMEMGKVICVPDPEAAKARDAAFFNGAVPPPPPFPGLIGGVIATDEAGRPLPGAGTLLPHDDLEASGRRERLDAVTGRAFVLITTADDVGGLDADSRALAERLGVRIIVLGEGGYRDVHGRLSGWLGAKGVSAVLARPDFYAFGAAASPAATGQLLQQLATRLAA